MQRLGHSSLNTTLNTYGYLIDETKEIDEQLVIDSFTKMFG